MARHSIQRNVPLFPATMPAIQRASEDWLPAARVSSDFHREYHAQTEVLSPAIKADVGAQIEPGPLSPQFGSESSRFRLAPIANWLIV